MKINLDNTNFSHDGKMLDGEALKNRQSQLKSAMNKGDEIEFNKLGGQAELDNVTKKINDARQKINNNKEVTADTDPRNTFQKELNPMATGIAKVTKKADHSGGAKSQIMTNSQALSEEIYKMRYLIEYMNKNNNKQKL
jgi:hypothetical protein|tara:strand:+ start:16793 stop:17209 length:417 start_codon:yes stop_codon:yes gene_type:complete